MLVRIIDNNHPAFPQGAPPSAKFLMVLDRLMECPVLSQTKATYSIISGGQYQSARIDEWAEPLMYKGGMVKVTFQAYIPNPDAPKKEQSRGRVESPMLKPSVTEMPAKDKLVKLDRTVLDTNGNVLFPVGSLVPSKQLADMLDYGIASMGPAPNEKPRLSVEQFEALKAESERIAAENARKLAEEDKEIERLESAKRKK